MNQFSRVCLGRRHGVALIVGSLLTTSQLAQAETSVAITLNPDAALVAAAMGTSEADMENQMRTKIQEIWDGLGVESYLAEFSNATAMSTRGVGVDYASLTEGLVLGIAGNLSVASDIPNKPERPSGGIAGNAGIMLGANLGWLGVPRLTLFGNVFSFAQRSGLLEGRINSMGVHAKLKVILPSDNAADLAFKWHGLDVTAGVENVRWTLSLGKTLNQTLPIQGGGSTHDVNFAANGRVELATNATTIPVEVSTAGTILMFATLYGGVGMDFQVGSTNLEASVDGPLTYTDEVVGTTRNLGTAKVTANGSGGPSASALRGFAGLQLNLWKLKFFAQVDANHLPTVSAAFGARVAF